MPAASLPGSWSCGRKTSCPPSRRPCATSAFQARSAAEKSGPAKYSFIAASIAEMDPRIAAVVVADVPGGLQISPSWPNANETVAM